MPALLTASADYSLVTDALRTAGVQGDGRLAGAGGGYGIYAAATNLFTNGGSESTVALGSGSAATPVRDTGTHLFGTAATLVTASAGNAEHYAAAAGPACTATQYTLSAYLWRGTSQWVCLADSGDAALHGAWFDILNGTVGSTRGSVDSKSIAAAANGWYRCIVTFTRTNATTINPRLTVASADNVATFNAAGTENASIDGIQVEAGALATPYVETNGSTATRAAGRLQLPAGLLNSAQGWLAACVRPDWPSTTLPSASPAVFDARVDNNNYLGLYYAGGAWAAYRVVGGFGTAASVTRAHAAGAPVWLVAAWTPTTLALSVAGSAPSGGSLVANYSQPALYGLALFDLGSVVGTLQLSGGLLGVLCGLGTLTAADYQTIAGLGTSSPAVSVGLLPAAANTQAAWNAVTGLYTVKANAGVPSLAQLPGGSLALGVPN